MSATLGNDELLTELQAAIFLTLSSRTLQAWRLKGVGPPYVRLGRAIRYRRSDLVAWLAKQTYAPAAPAATPRISTATTTVTDPLAAALAAHGR